MVLSVKEFLSVHQITSRTVPGSIPGGVIGFFSDILLFRQLHGPGVDLVLSENKYQEYFFGVEVAGA